MTVLYGIKTCDTVRKARAWLDAHGVDHRFHDFRLDGLEVDRLKAWAGKVGWQVLLNKASTTFRDLPERERQDIGEQHALGLMFREPTMIKRPVIEWQGGVLVGFKPETYEKAFAP